MDLYWKKHNNCEVKLKEKSRIMNLNLNKTLFVYIVILSLSLSSTLINALRIEEKGKKMFFAYLLNYIKLIIL